MTSPRKKIRLGDLLIESKLISQAQLEQALADQKTSGQKLGKVLIDNGYVTEEQMLEMLSQQLKIPFVDLVSRPVVSGPSRLPGMTRACWSAWLTRPISLPTTNCPGF